MTRHDDFGALETRIGYHFRSRTRLREALTHASARPNRADRSDNERLEFLGDRVLGLVIAEWLLEAYPQADEGELARRFNRLVRRETCAAVAGSMRLGDHIILGEGEAGAGGRRKSTILADACEALLGALYLDGGLTLAQHHIRRHWAPWLTDEAAVPLDAKTALQEWAQGRKYDLPRYVSVKSEGPDHAPCFTVEVRIPGLDPARGQGPSKRLAEQAAAHALLVREGVWETAANG